MTYTKEPRNARNAGRPGLYTNEELIEIIDQFMIHKFKNKITAELLAEYADEWATDLLIKTKNDYYKKFIRMKKHHFERFEGKRPKVQGKIDNIKAT